MTMTIRMGGHTLVNCVRSAVSWGIAAREEGEEDSISEVGQLRPQL